MNLLQPKGGLVLVSGPPGVGKSSLAKQLHAACGGEGEFKPVFLVSFDQVLTRDVETRVVENNEWKASRSLIRQLIGTLISYLRSAPEKTTFQSFCQQDSALSAEQSNLRESFLSIVQQQQQERRSNGAPFLIIIDDLFYYESMRTSYVQLAHETECFYYNVCLKPPSIDFLLERNTSRASSEQLPLDVIRNVANKFEYPDTVDWERGFSTTLSSPINISVISSLQHELRTRLAQLEPEILATRAKAQRREQELEEARKSRETLVHKSDCLLRKLIGEFLASQKGNKDLAKILSAKKAAILKELRENDNNITMLSDDRLLDEYLKEKLFENVI